MANQYIKSEPFTEKELVENENKKELRKNDLKKFILDYHLTQEKERYAWTEIELFESLLEIFEERYKFSLINNLDEYETIFNLSEAISNQHLSKMLLKESISECERDNISKLTKDYIDELLDDRED